MIIMKNRSVRIKAFMSLLLAFIIAISSLPICAMEINDDEKETSDYDTGLPFSFKLEPGDLTLSQLKDAVLDEESIPAVISPELTREREHVNRLYLQEPDDNTVIFQNRDGSKTVYYFSIPVKSNGRDLNYDDLAILTSEDSDPAIRITDKKLSFAKINEQLKRLDGECPEKKIYYYNLGYAEIQTFDSQIKTSGTDITDDVRGITQQRLDKDVCYELADVVMRDDGHGTGNSANVPGASGNLCFAYTYSELAGIVRLRNYSTGTFLKNTNGTLTMGTTGSVMNQQVRWILCYIGSSKYYIRAFYLNQNTHSYLSYVNGTVSLTGSVSNNCRWYFDSVSVSGTNYYYIRPVTNSSYALNSSISCGTPAGSTYYWEVNDLRNIATSIVSEGTAVMAPGANLNDFITVYPSNALAYIEWTYSDGTSVGVNDEGDPSINTPGIYEIYYWESYSDIGIDPSNDETFAVIVSDEGPEEFSGKYVNISRLYGSTRKNLCCSSTGTLSATTPDGQDIYQSLKLTAVNPASNEYKISYFVPELVNGAYTGHLNEIYLSNTGSTVSMVSAGSLPDSCKWYVLKVGTGYAIVNKATKKVLTVSGNSIAVTELWSGITPWNLYYSGVYAFRLKGTTKYMDIPDGLDNNNTAAEINSLPNTQVPNTQDWVKLDSKKFRITYNYDMAAYSIRPVCSKNGYGLLLSTDSSNNIVQTYLLADNNSNRQKQLYSIEYINGYYCFVSKQKINNTEYCISAASDASEASVKSVARNTSSDLQKWEFVSVFGTSDSIDDPEQTVKQEIYYRSMSLGLPLDISNTSDTLKITSDFGARARGIHYGVDFRSLLDSGYALQLLSVLDGVVMASGETDEGGNYVTLTSSLYKQYSITSTGGQTLYFYFCHLSSSSVSGNASVSKGATLGVTGSTGISHGIHLHMSVTTRSDNISYTTVMSKNVNPLLFFNPSVYSAECWLANGLQF